MYGDNKDLQVTTGDYPHLLTMNPGWNKVEIADTAVVTDNFYGQFNGTSGTWKISSVYAATDAALENQEVSNTNRLIAALPEATEIGDSHRAAVANADAAYKALTADQQAKVENVEKLSACVAKVETWDAYDSKTVIDITDSTTGVVD